MNIQLVIGVIILGAALFFIGRRIWKSFSGKGHGACADCGTLEQAANKKGVPQ